jgi:hypothetical protein
LMLETSMQSKNQMAVLHNCAATLKMNSIWRCAVRPAYRDIYREAEGRKKIQRNKLHKSRAPTADPTNPAPRWSGRDVTTVS